jgi:hypothetical protein
MTYLFYLDFARCHHLYMWKRENNKRVKPSGVYAYFSMLRLHVIVNEPAWLAVVIR